MNEPENVVVLLGYKRSYKFHSGTLARNSTLFADLLTESNAAKLSKRAQKAGVKVRWMIELRELPTYDCPSGKLELVKLNRVGERADGKPALVVNENGLAPQMEETAGYYQSILYSFYSRPLVVTDTDLREALKDCGAMAYIAEYLGCMPAISKSLELALLGYHDTMYRGIKENPQAWIGMACRIRSEVIFREAMIHIVGNWKTVQGNATAMERLEEIPNLFPLIEKYHEKLLERGKKLQHQILSHFPGRMNAPSEERPIKVHEYERQMLAWMALTWFRQWFGERVTENQGWQGDDCGYKLFKRIATGGEEYLDKNILPRINEQFPITRRALSVAADHLLVIKKAMKEVVKEDGILKTKCHLDLNMFPVEYLTCIDIRREDLPWVNEDQLFSSGMDGLQGGNALAQDNLAISRRAQQQDHGEMEE